MNYDLRNAHVYLSGPVTGHSRELVIEDFRQAEQICHYLGASEVFNPTKTVPEGMPHDLAMVRCLNELTIYDWEAWPERKSYYDVLVQLDGWPTSQGARLEAAVAQACGIEAISIKKLKEQIDYE